jgi:hypothetical protein
MKIVVDEMPYNEDVCPYYYMYTVGMHDELHGGCRYNGCGCDCPGVKDCPHFIGIDDLKRKDDTNA